MIGIATIVVFSGAIVAMGDIAERRAPTAGPTGRTYSVGPAPAGDPAEVALPIIRERQPGICPAIQQAVRIFDGSIRAVCTDGNVVRIMSLRETGHVLALRCIPPADGSVSLC